MIKLEMIKYNTTLTEEHLKSGKIDKYDFLTDEEILSSDQGRIIEQAKFIHSPTGQALETK